MVWVAPLTGTETAMKTIASTPIALSILAGIAGPLTALDTKTFHEQHRARH
jgi:hypothetical protein